MLAPDVQAGILMIAKASAVVVDLAAKAAITKVQTKTKSRKTETVNA